MVKYYEALSHAQSLNEPLTPQLLYKIFNQIQATLIPTYNTAGMGGANLPHHNRLLDLQETGERIAWGISNNYSSSVCFIFCATT